MDPFVAEIRIFPFYFAPKGWAFCDGQLMPISQNTALFSLLGTYYGGDGKSTFALPDLQGSVPMHPGTQIPGLSDHFLGEMGGSETVTLLTSEMPIHTHVMQSGPTFLPADSNVPTGNSLGKSTNGKAYIASANLTTMADEALSVVGADFPHNNMQPYLTLNFCIALQGVFPQRP